MKNFFSFLFLAMAFVVSATPTQAGNLNVLGTTTGGPTWNRPVAGNPPIPPPSGVGTIAHYSTIEFYVDVSGLYTFQAAGTNPPSWDNYTFLYQNTFDPANPFTNVLIGNDDNPNIGLSGFSYNLTAGVQYIFVITGFGNGDEGDWTATIQGVGTPRQGTVRCGPGGQNVKMCYYGLEICVPQSYVARYKSIGATIGACGAANTRIGYEPETANLPLTLSLKAYPNPVQDVVTAEVLSRVAGEATFEVLDVTGHARQSRKQELVEGLNEVKFGLSTLPTGIYLIRAVDAMGQQAVVRLSKQ